MSASRTLEIADRSRRCDCGCGRPAPLRLTEVDPSVDLAFSTKCSDKYEGAYQWATTKDKQLVGQGVSSG